MPVASTSSIRKVSPPVSRTDFVRDNIKEAILSGEFAPGQTLVEAELGAQLGVSKTPVREALRILAGSGLVMMSTYKGASVRVIDATIARSVYDLRALLEPEALRRAVERGTDFTEAREILAEVDAGDRAQASLTNRRFHRALYANCGNALLVEILDGLRDQAALITVTGWGIDPTWQGEAAEHLAILTAAVNGDAPDAESLLRKHITDFIGRVAPSLTTGTERGAR
jgi:DNA-binding GntR family transcriptional regulator